jgi:hypothetical protein
MKAGARIKQQVARTKCAQPPWAQKPLAHMLQITHDPRGEGISVIGECHAPHLLGYVEHSNVAGHYLLFASLVYIP